MSKEIWEKYGDLVSAPTTPKAMPRIGEMDGGRFFGGPGVTPKPLHGPALAEAQQGADLMERRKAAPKTNWEQYGDPVLTPEQEDAANQWAEELALIRKNHGDRAVDVAGEGVVAAKDDVGLWRQAQAAAKRSGWKAPEKANLGEGVATGANDFAFGFGDEFASGVNAAKAFLWNLPGKGMEGAAKASRPAAPKAPEAPAPASRAICTSPLAHC
jgi:hypothetical protein